ncbi:MAG: hypothetical protein E7614_01425 [Ruminococcaceae bacterium]|nr:hypothetical protein [Oscillospiraceae bacterium]
MKARKFSGKVVTIAINDSNINLCEVAFKGEVLKVFKSIDLKTPEFSFEDGIIKDYPAIVKALNDAFNENQIKTKRVVFSVSSSKILSKEIIIPALGSHSRILSLVTANSGEYFPVSTEDCVYSYSLLDEFEEEENGASVKKMRIMAYAVSNDIINSRYELAKQLGLNVLSVDYTGNTIVEVCKRQVPATVNMTLLINSNATVVSIFANNRLKMQRTISSGSGMITNAIARAYNVSDSEVATMLDTTSLKTFVQEKPLVADAVEDYFNSILRVYEFYRAKFPDAPVDEAFIFGKGGEIIDIGEFFEAQIDVPVTMLEKLTGIEREVEGTETDVEAMERDKALFRYIDALGSIYGTLDFVSKEMEGDRIARARNRVYFGAVMVAVVVSAVLVLIPLVEVLNLRQDKKFKERELAELPDVTPIYNAYADAYAKYKDIISFQGTTETEAEALNNFIEALEVMRPESCKITGLSCSADGAVSMAVLADSWDTCAKFIMQLKAMTLVEDVRVSSITQSVDENGNAVFAFSASCEITNEYIDSDIVTNENNSKK